MSDFPYERVSNSLREIPTDLWSYTELAMPNAKVSLLPVPDLGQRPIIMSQQACTPTCVRWLDANGIREGLKRRCAVSSVGQAVGTAPDVIRVRNSGRQPTTSVQAHHRLRRLAELVPDHVRKRSANDLNV